MRDISIHWSLDPNSTIDLVDFFVANVSAGYISSGEVTDGRALDFSHWVPDLRAQMTGEIASALAGTSGVRAAVMRSGTQLAGLALVSWQPEARVPHAVLDDVIIGFDHRGSGLGGRLIDFVEDEARRSGLRALFLESGRSNEGAHRFFERRGFAVCSIQMARWL